MSQYFRRLRHLFQRKQPLLTTEQTFLDALNIGYLTANISSEKLERILHSITDLSAGTPAHYKARLRVDRIVGPLRFDFLPNPLILRCNTGIGGLWEQIEKPILLQSQGILVDFGSYLPHLKNTDGYPGHSQFLVFITKEKVPRPTIYMVHGVEEQIEIDLLKSKMRLEESDILMVNNTSNPDSLKKILQKLVQKINENTG
jgi:hypothetical protein